MHGFMKIDASIYVCVFNGIKKAFISQPEADLLKSRLRYLCTGPFKNGANNEPKASSFPWYKETLMLDVGEY
jgi:hypothetical protein